MNFILGLYYYHKKNDDKIIEKEMSICSIYGVIILETNIHDFIKKMFKSLENGYGN